MKSRYEELDSLRGLAALSVLFSHFMLVFPSIENDTLSDGLTELNLIKYSPFHILFAGHEAVIFFFVLSGFVLSLLLFRTEKESYNLYTLKRILRIYPPYIVAVMFAICVTLFVQESNLVGLSEWIQTRMEAPITFTLVLQHILFLGEFNANDINPVLWSMVHEMRISLIFPLVVYFLSKWNFYKTVLVSVVISLAGIILMKFFQVEGSATNYFITLHYLSFFIVGGLLAKYRFEIIRWFKSKSTFFFFNVGLIGLLAYTYSWLFKDVNIIHNILIDDWVVVVGASLFIILALSSDKISKILRIKPIAYLGKISYSLYLYHGVVLVACLNMFVPKIGIELTLLISFILSIVLSSVGYYLVEKPSIILSRKISKNQKTKRLKEEKIS